MERARWSLERARAKPVPKIDLQAAVQHDNATRNDVASVQVGLPLPLLNRNQGGIRKAQAELAAAQSDVRRAELDLQHRLATVYQRYASARQQTLAYRDEILPDAKASIDLVRKGYEAGEFGYLTLLTAQRTYFQTSLAYLESLRQLRETTVAIDGLLLTGSLSADSEAKP